jgi:hypothetical protein
MKAIRFLSGKFFFYSFGKIADWRVAIVLALATVTSGCGSSNMTSVPSQAPQILTQPANQNTRIGQTAVFTVVAHGTAPLSYQWSKNGTAITGATRSSYTTPVAVPGDEGAVFSVAVTNSIASVSSTGASLRVGARAPQVGDLRFQQVAAPSTIPGLRAGGTHSDVFAGLGQFFEDHIGTPLTMGAGTCNAGVGNPVSCIWFFSSFGLPSGVSGLTTNYQGFNSSVFPLDSQLRSLDDGHSVITSLDLELSNIAYAASWIKSANVGGFQYFQQTVAPDQFQAVASQLGEQSRVITAASFDESGDVYFVNYGWLTDQTTRYEVKVSTASLDNIGVEATNLANAGYIITALGGNPTAGFILVGTRVQGDTLSRPVLVIPTNTAADLDKVDQLMKSGDAIVGMILNTDFSNTYIGEQ